MMIKVSMRILGITPGTIIPTHVANGPKTRTPDSNSRVFRDEAMTIMDSNPRAE